MVTVRAPSIKTLTRDLRITREEAKTVRGLIKGDIDPEDIEATDRWIRQCYNRPWESSLIMHAIDATIGTCGVECIGDEDKEAHESADFDYCNAGDTYAATIIRDNNTGRYFVGCWGDCVEG